MQMYMISTKETRQCVSTHETQKRHKRDTKETQKRHKSVSTKQTQKRHKRDTKVCVYKRDTKETQKRHQSVCLQKRHKRDPYNKSTSADNPLSLSLFHCLFLALCISLIGLSVYLPLSLSLSSVCLSICLFLSLSLSPLSLSYSLSLSLSLSPAFSFSLYLLLSLTSANTIKSLPPDATCLLMCVLQHTLSHSSGGNTHSLLSFDVSLSRTLVSFCVFLFHMCRSVFDVSLSRILVSFWCLSVT